eukprot:TRINITY_DN19132_c0_g1_i2.p1 TRINITY_DN19132_c0_g1~~TRINITY_DN19132_c0_g1_i2.p1  ORF type:complete len:393 (+),score=79.87 TRINITY_DN19132_c0_g1_i2:73-1179(+)
MALEDRLPPGTQVELVNLTKSAEDNGKTGSVVGFDPKKERYQVDLSFGRRNLKRDNLKKVVQKESTEDSTGVKEDASPTKGSESQEKHKEKKRRRSRSNSAKRRSRSQSRSRSSKRPRTTESKSESSAAPEAGKLLSSKLSGKAAGRSSFSKGKAGGKGSKDRTMQISKAMAFVLRHNAVSLGLVIRPDGFCKAADMLALQNFKTIGCTMDDLQSAVNTNDKKRFEILEEDGEVFVRAVQGHSMKVVSDDSLLQRLSLADATLPKVCVHGTYRRCLDSIRQKGLLAGGGKSKRNHIHFAPYEPGDGRVISGMRYDCEIAIYLDLKKALQAQIPFFRSTNEVLLSPGIDGVIAADYIEKIKDLKSGQFL